MANSIEIERALSFIDNQDREKWVRMGAAIKSELGEPGYEIWDHWSQSADTYNAQASKAVWQSLRPGFVGIGSLYYEAKQAGYLPEKSSSIDLQVLQERQAQRKEVEAQALAERSQAAEKAKDKANTLWNNAEPADPKHPYLVNKGITDPALIGSLRQDRYQNLLVPVKQDKELVAVQRINAEGAKFFGKGSAISGSAFLIGDAAQAKEQGLVLTEGLATGASIHQATGQPVLVVFAAHNLVTVAEKVKHVDAPFILAADNDHSETGIKFAEKAQEVLGDKAMIVMPDFDKDAITAYQRRHGEGKYPSDFNDLHELNGLNSLRSFFQLETLRDSNQEDKTMNKPVVNTIEVDLERNRSNRVKSDPKVESQVKENVQSQAETEVKATPSVSEQAQDVITNLKYKAPPKSLETKYVYAEGKYYDRTGSTVLFDDKGKALATTRLDRQTVYDMIEVAKEKHWDAVVLKGSPDFRRFAYLEAESQGIQTRGYSPTPADLKLVDQLRDERALNKIEKDSEREPSNPAQAASEADKMQAQNQMPTSAQIETSAKADVDSDVPMAEITTTPFIPSEVKVAAEKMKQSETNLNTARFSTVQYYKGLAKQAVNYMKVGNRADAQRNFDTNMDKALNGTAFNMPTPLQAETTQPQNEPTRTHDNKELEIER